MKIIFLIVCFFVSLVSPKPLTYNAIFSFGDSITDTGNYLLSAAGSLPLPVIGKLPYGETFFEHPTGRCSDGRLIIDFITEAYGLPFLPPYLAVEEGVKAENGVNFAVAGATATDDRATFFNATRNLMTKNSLSVQLGWFKKVKSKLCNTKQECGEHFKKSLFLVGEIGYNDYNSLYFRGRSTTQHKALSVSSVIGATVELISVLIEDGAVEVMVPGILPIGCAAVYLTSFGTPNKAAYDENGCLKAYNTFSKYHNAQLKLALLKLRQEYPHANIIYADYYGAAMRFYHSPKHYGFSNTLSACCGGGGPYNVNYSAVCGYSGSKVCLDYSKYANWDGLHLTEAAYHQIAKGLLNGPFLSPPLTFSPIKQI